MLAFLTRAVLGGIIGIFVGENVLSTGLLNSSLFVPLFIWYVFLFLTFDWFIFNFKLSDRRFLMLAGIFAILIGGILDKEFFAPAKEMGIFGLDPFSVVLNTFWWGVSCILIFNLINNLIHRSSFNLGFLPFALFTVQTFLTVGGTLPLIISAVNPLGLIFLLTLVLILFFLFKRLKNEDNRPLIQKSRFFSLLPILLIVFAPPLLGPESYWQLSAILVLGVILTMWRFRIQV